MSILRIHLQYLNGQKVGKPYFLQKKCMKKSLKKSLKILKLEYWITQNI